MIDWLFWGIALFVLICASLMDLRRREVDDYLSYGLFGFALILRGSLSVVLQDGSFILEGVFGFLIALGIGIFMFYTRQWGGGDSKLLMGLGALIGFTLQIDTMFISFVINTLIFGSLYTLFWACFLLVRNRTAFIQRFKTYLHDVKRPLQIGFLLFVLMSAFVFVSFTFTTFLVTTVIGCLLFLLVVFIALRSIEDTCFIVSVPPSELTPGDWVYEEIWVKQRTHRSLLSSLQAQMKLHFSEMKDNDWVLSLFHLFDVITLQYCSGLLSRLKTRRIAALRKRILLSPSQIVQELTDEFIDQALPWYRRFNLFRQKLPLQQQTQIQRLVHTLVHARSRESYEASVDALDTKLSLEQSVATSLEQKFHFSSGHDYVCGKGDLGLEEKQLEKLLGLNRNEVRIKRGIPFVPTFLIGFVMTLILDAWYLTLFVL